MPQRWSLGLVLVAAISIALLLPFLRMVLGFGDEGVILHGATRLLDGERLYADFFEFLPPGAFLIVAGWFSITDVSFFGARVLTLLVITAVSCLTYLNCLRVSGSPVLSAAVVIGWMLATHGGWLHVSHHWFTTFFCVLLMWAALAFVSAARQRLWLPIVAGLAGGAAAMIIPSRGAFALIAGLAAFAGMRGGREAVAAYCAATAVVPGLIIIWLMSLGTIAVAYEAVILFTIAQYSSIQGVPFGHSAGPQNAILVFMFPIAGMLLVLLLLAERRTALRDGPLHVCVAFAVTAFLALLVRPDIFKIMVAAPMVLPLLALTTSRLPLPTFRRWPALRWGLLATIFMPSAIDLTANANAVLRQDQLQTPRGVIRVARGSAQSEVMRRVLELPDADSIFFYPYLPLMAFLTARKHPAHVDLFIPNYTTAEQYGASFRSAQACADWVVFDHSWTDAVLADVFPFPLGYNPPERTDFEAALLSIFVSVARDGPYELLRRDSAVNREECAALEIQQDCRTLSLACSFRPLKSMR